MSSVCANRMDLCAGHLAQAVKGLNPKINIWTTGSGEGPSADSMGPLRNLFTTLPPLVSTSTLRICACQGSYAMPTIGTPGQCASSEICCCLSTIISTGMVPRACAA